jgi:AcrR family transcriptional regulator
MTKLSLSEVANQAGVSRPTLYRWFSSKRELMDAFVAWERHAYERAVAKASEGLLPEERLDTALRGCHPLRRRDPYAELDDLDPLQRFGHGCSSHSVRDGALGRVRGHRVPYDRRRIRKLPGVQGSESRAGRAGSE